MLLGPLDSNVRAHVVATSSVDINTGLAAGVTIDDVILQVGYLVVLTAQTDGTQNGIYEVPRVGIAPRHKDFREWDNLAGQTIQIMLGTVGSDTKWEVTSNPGGVLGVNDLAIAEVISNVPSLDAADVIVTPAGTIGSIDVQSALEEIDGDVQGKLNSSDYTAADILTKLQTVDGPASGLDADLLDGVDSSAFFLKADVDPATNPVSPSDLKVMSQLAAITLINSLLVGGSNFKLACVVATTTNGTLATAFENGDTVNGVVLVTGDRILLKDQTVQTENGIYTVNASGAPTRTVDGDTGPELISAVIPVVGGTFLPNTLWIQITPATITIGTSSIVFTQIPVAGAYLAGLRLLLTAQSFSIDTAAYGKWPAGFDTRALAAAATINAAEDAVQLLGRAVLGDGGQALLSEVGSDPGVGGFADGGGRFFHFVKNPRYAASPFGILPADNGAAALINDAIQWLANGERRAPIDFLPEKYNITSTVLLDRHNVKLRGCADQTFTGINASSPETQWANLGGTRWIWGGGADKMLVMRPAPMSPQANIFGAGAGGIVLEGMGIATHGFEFLSGRGCVVPKLLVSNCITTLFHFGVVDPSEVTGTQDRCLQHNILGFFYASAWHANSAGATCFLFDGDLLSNVSLQTVQDIMYLHKNGPGIDMVSSDATVFGNVKAFRIPGGTGPGCRIRAGAGANDFPRHHCFNFAQFGTGGLHITEGGGGVKPHSIVVLDYDLGNSTPRATVDAGCGATIHYSDGAVLYSGGLHIPTASCEIFIVNDGVYICNFDNFVGTNLIALVEINTATGLKSQVPVGQFRARVGANPFTENISITTTSVNFTTGILNGVTGVAGKFTISPATNGNLYFENRTGVPRSISIRLVV